jgi:hypothetical protein
MVWKIKLVSISGCDLRTTCPLRKGCLLPTPTKTGSCSISKFTTTKKRGYKKYQKIMATSTPDSSTPGLLFIGDVEPIFVAIHQEPG